MRKLLKKYGFVPDKLVTDELRSYAAAASHLGIAKRHERGRWRNNRAESSTRERRRFFGSVLWKTKAWTWRRSGSRRSGAAEILDFDTVSRDLERALASAKDDPEDAVTAACSTVESVCRSILIELALDLPEKKDVKGLFAAVRKPLGLSSNRTDLAPLIADDVRKILNGLATAVEGIGALRTHGGDAHGRERGYARVDRRIASLAIHAASTVALFLIETWQRKYPRRDLRLHGTPQNDTPMKRASR
jgi:hypothetical protein